MTSRCGPSRQSNATRAYGRCDCQSRPFSPLLWPLTTTRTRSESVTKSYNLRVGKADALSFIAGHTHEVRGPIENGSVEVDFDNPSQARVRLAIATSELKVIAAGEPEGDAPKVQEAMSGEKVLDVAHHPRVIFESAEATLKSRRGTRLDLIVTGQLTVGPSASGCPFRFASRSRMVRSLRLAA